MTTAPHAGPVANPMTDLSSEGPSSAAFLGRVRGWPPPVAIVAFAALVLVGIWTTAIWLLSSSRNGVMKDARDELVGAQRIISAQIGRTFDTARGVLRFTDIWLEDQASSAHPHPLDDLVRRFDLFQEGNEVRFNVLLFDTAGDKVLLRPDEPEAINVADREYIRALAGRPAGTVYIGNQIRTRNAGALSIPVAMKAKDNPFGIAYVVTSVPIAPLVAAFERLLITAPGSIGILRTDGTFLLLNPDPKALTGSKVEMTSAARRLAEGHATGFLDSWRGPTGEELMVAFSRIPSQPLIVFANFRISALERRTQSDMEIKIGLAAIASAFVIAFSSWLIFLVRQRERETERAIGALAAAEEASSAKTQFLANLSHELRTPLNAIIGFAEMQHAQIFGPLHDRYRGYAADILASGRHLLGIISQLLDMASIESRQERLEIGPVAVGQVIDEAMRILEPMAQDRGVALSARTSGTGEPGRIESDERAIRQILINLAGNAIRFSAPGEVVTIDCRRTPTGVTIAVEDRGIGIAPEELPRIFDLFWQRGDAYTRRQGGLGLGLSLTKKFVEALGGTIAVESEPGQGSVFAVTLPGAHPLPHGRA